MLGKNENSSGGEAGVGTMSQGGWVSERVGEPGKGSRARQGSGGSLSRQLCLELSW